MQIRIRAVVPALFAGVFLLSACTTPSASHAPAPAMSASASRTAAAGELAARPGLGTRLGHEVYERLEGTQFFRHAGTGPQSVAVFHYNDKMGAETQAKLSGRMAKRSGSFPLAGGRLRAALTDHWGTRLPWYESEGRIIVVGRTGQTYRIELHNTTKSRMEAVVSVDGLDVLDGGSASFTKRGYVIEPKSSVQISGMKSGGRLRSFVFGTVAESQAARVGGEKGARNVGAIGVALYEEDEAAARRFRVREALIREEANPFPGR